MAAADLVADLLERFVGRGVAIEHFLSLADMHVVDETYAAFRWWLRREPQCCDSHNNTQNH